MTYPPQVASEENVTEGGLTCNRRYYSSLQNAYDAAIDGDTIQSQTNSFNEDLYIDLEKAVTLQGGYNSDFTAVTGMTTLSGNLTIRNGIITIENFIAL